MKSRKFHNIQVSSLPQDSSENTIIMYEVKLLSLKLIHILLEIETTSPVERQLETRNFNTVILPQDNKEALSSNSFQTTDAISM